MYDHRQSLKEVIRHALFRCGKADLLNFLRHWRGQNTDHIDEPDLADTFRQIYASGAWGAWCKQESLSGEGSTRSATADLVVGISAFLKEVNCRQLIDIGCGDFNWMKNVHGDFDYVGLDIVRNVIDDNIKKYTATKRRFAYLDAVNESLVPGDVAICREVLFHLSFRDGQTLLDNIRAAGFKFVLLTNDKSVWFNSDIRNGDFRRVNLLKAPYNLPEPARELSDSKVVSGRVLGVWDGDLSPVRPKQPPNRLKPT